MTKEGIFKKLWLISIVFVMLIVGIVVKSNIIQMVSSISGVIYVALIAAEKRAGYIFGIINVIFYSIVSFSQELYGLTLYNMLYSLPVLVYGYVKWGNKEDNDIRTLSSNTRLITICIVILLIIMYVQTGMLLGGALANLIVDGISVIIGAISTFLMTRKYIEQWVGFITVNVTTLIYWIINSVGNSSNYIMIIMWSIYTLNNIYGIVLWSKSRKEKLNKA